MSYDIERLKALPLEQVIEWLGGQTVKQGKTLQMRCFNKAAHNANDRHPSMTIWVDTNSCKCFACGVGGDTIAVASEVYGGFQTACKALSHAFNVPLLDGTISSGSARPPKPEKPVKVRVEFDYTRDYTLVDLDRHFKKYPRMTDMQKLKMVYTTVYRHSLATDQSKKLAWYSGKRGIKEDHYLLDRIGWLDNESIKTLCLQLENVFPIEDLIRFKLYNAADEKHGPRWKYYSDTGFAVIPFHELYSDMVNGFMLRNISPKAGKFKEVQVSCSDVAMPIPFALSREMFLGGEDYVFITEGHVDGLSLGGKPFVASPGTFGLRDEVLSLLRGKKVYILFDMDDAGKSGAKDLTSRFKEIEIEATILEWDSSLGKDLNECLLNGNLKSGIFKKII